MMGKAIEFVGIAHQSGELASVAVHIEGGHEEAIGIVMDDIGNGGKALEGDGHCSTLHGLGEHHTPSLIVGGHAEDARVLEIGQR